ncbi:hypothetical protein DE146DRAFT_308972 [Phaeosphaeria sp. MPI-PUGE-AT-0046c]|nr:hypothetical protein DE146DRAFT_308972 [Phaeosphaeria sp. MPI-PUGE-AT-0046c]
MPIPRLPRRTLRRLCLYPLLVAPLAILVFATFFLALPMRRAHYLELDYQRKLIHPSKNRHQLSTYVQPLVEDAEQLFLWTDPSSKFRTYDASLGLNHDATAQEFAARTETWIYLASTASDSAPQPFAYTHKWKNPYCIDPGFVCDAYLDAFRRIAKRWPKAKRSGPNGMTSRTQLRWVDCDVSPMLCSPFFGLAGSNLLVHMTVGADCDFSMIPTGSCPVTWRWVGLPVMKAPWTRQIRIKLDRGGSTVVPAFPSAEEQMWTIMAYDGALDALKYGYGDEQSTELERNSMCTVTPQCNAPPVTHGGPAPFSMWGMFRSFVDNPWQLPEWPYEIEVKCYIERYADVLLRWWDDAADLVEPRSCVGVAEATRNKRREDETFWGEQDEKFREKYDKMMNETYARIKKWAAQKDQGVVNDIAEGVSEGEVEGKDSML